MDEKDFRVIQRMKEIQDAVEDWRYCNRTPADLGTFRELLAELSRLRSENEALKLERNTWEATAHAVQNELALSREFAKEERDRLREVLEKAPHAPNCWSVEEICDNCESQWPRLHFPKPTCCLLPQIRIMSCNCWKSTAISPEKPTDKHDSEADIAAALTRAARNRPSGTISVTLSPAKPKGGTA